MARKDAASYAFSRSGWGKKRKRWLHLYRIYPPADKQFLPSDEALRTLVATIPGIRFYKSARFEDRDMFMVYGANKNIFTARADRRGRELRKGFLRDVGIMALAQRTIPAHVQEAAEAFISECGFTQVIWNGSHATAYDRNGKRHEGLRIKGGTFWRPFRRFEHLCKPILPFRYGADHP